MQQTENRPYSLFLLGVLFFSAIFTISAALSADIAVAQVGAAEVEARRAQLEAELAELEKEIEGQRVILRDKQRESVSLERDVAILNAEIEKARLSIRARNISIGKLEGDINSKSKVIGSLSDKMRRQRESLAELLRKTNEIDEFTIVEIALGNENLSDFFVDVDSYDALKQTLNESFDELRTTKKQTENEKEQLEDKRLEEVELRQIQQLEKQRVETNESEKKNLLDITKGQEKQYQKIISVKEKDAATIRTELFTLRGSEAIPFEKALMLANRASAQTGVRPALILGTIAEESNLGENVGTGTWTIDMHPTRDRPVFEKITARLGLNPDALPVSKKPWYGWGGAMGPAQFIPSTWVLYEDRIAKLTGHNPPNPWDPGDAFMAAGVLLMDNGADKGGYNAERLAALRYFAGWKNATKAAYAFYGDDVMVLTDKYQGLIDILARN